MDKWEEMYNKAKKEYHREEVSPFIIAHHVVSAVESEDGEIFTGFCIESASGVMNLCAERVAALNMYINTGKTKIKKLIAFRENPPHNGGMPCGACREFLMQLNRDNKDMEILTDYETRTTIKLSEVLPNWWGDKRYNNNYITESKEDELKIISEKLEIINQQLYQQQKLKRKSILYVLISLAISVIVIFFILSILNSPYLNWDYNNPENAVLGVACHSFEWCFVRIAPLILISSIFGIILIKKNK